jgi:hypothetical protein
MDVGVLTWEARVSAALASAVPVYGEKRAGEVSQVWRHDEQILTDVGGTGVGGTGVGGTGVGGTGVGGTGLASGSGV